MSKIKETAAQRRAREAQEAREAQARWEAEKPMRLLQALARARDLSIDAFVSYKYDNVLYYSFTFMGDDQYANVWSDPVAELTEYAMGLIEAELEVVHQAHLRRLRLAEVRAQTLATLTDEQKEALGL